MVPAPAPAVELLKALALCYYLSGRRFESAAGGSNRGSNLLGPTRTFRTILDLRGKNFQTGRRFEPAAGGSNRGSNLLGPARKFKSARFGSKTCFWWRFHNSSQTYFGKKSKERVKTIKRCICIKTLFF